MQLRRIGVLEVSSIGLGCNQIGVTVDEHATRALVAAAVDNGITFFDTADEYGYGRSEKFLGRALGSYRDQVAVATKAGCVMPHEEGSGGAHPKWLRRAVEASLRRLGTDHIDLFQVHYPDPAVPIADTLGVLDDLARAGLIREFGCSNYSSEQLRGAVQAARAGGHRGYASLQVHLNLIRQQALSNEAELCAQQSLAVLPYWPLASGLLTGKYRRGRPLPAGSRLQRYPAAADRLLTARRLDLIDALTEVAYGGGVALADLAFAWLLAQPTVACVIAGATRPEQVINNAQQGNPDRVPAELVALAGRIGAGSQAPCPH